MPDLTARVLRHAGEAVVLWKMIDEGDLVLVCVSGGKDSWVLLHVLQLLQQRAPVRFELHALKVDYPHSAEENERIRAHCELAGIPFTLVETRIGETIEERAAVNKSRCSFCARLRRGHIYTQAKKLGATRIALGHHREDLNETLLLNLFHHGRIEAMRPRYRPVDHAFDVIRPLALTPEDDIAALAQTLGAPMIDDACPYADNTHRARTKTILAELQSTYIHIHGNLLAAQVEGGLLNCPDSAQNEITQQQQE